MKKTKPLIIFCGLLMVCQSLFAEEQCTSNDTINSCCYFDTGSSTLSCHDTCDLHNIVVTTFTADYDTGTATVGFNQNVCMDHTQDSQLYFDIIGSPAMSFNDKLLGTWARLGMCKYGGRSLKFDISSSNSIIGKRWLAMVQASYTAQKPLSFTYIPSTKPGSDMFSSSPFYNIYNDVCREIDMADIKGIAVPQE